MRVKSLFVFIAFLFPFGLYSQDTAKQRQIDSLVKLIDNSNFKIERDTVKLDYPEIGLSTRTFLTMVTDGGELKKYESKGYSTTQENGSSKQMATVSAFYFDHNKLVKVEESGTLSEQKYEAFYYYADDKPIFYTLKSDKGEERAAQLLIMAKAMLEKFPTGGKIGI